MNKERLPVDYKKIEALIQSGLKRCAVSVRTIRKYGEECDIKWKKNWEITLMVSAYTFRKVPVIYKRVAQKGNCVSKAKWLYRIS